MSKTGRSHLRASAALIVLLWCLPSAVFAADVEQGEVDAQTLDRWSAPYRGWHYWPHHVIPARPSIGSISNLLGTDVPTIYQLPDSDRYYMSFIGFDGSGYQSFVAESDDLLHWTNYRLAMGYGPTNEFDHGGCVIGAFLYESYDIKAPRRLKRHEGKFWTLYGAYPRQGGYELRPGYEGVAVSEEGLTWHRARKQPILSVHDPDTGAWEKSCIYQPWLLEHEGRYLNFYNAANGNIEQIGVTFSTNLLDWTRHPGNPVLRVRPGGYDEVFCSDGKVFRDGDHWTMFYFGVGRGGAHIMAAFSRDLLRWTSHPEPLYKTGGHPSGLDKQYAHKISLVHNPKNDTLYMFYNAVPGKNGPTGGRGIGLITSKPLLSAAPSKRADAVRKGKVFLEALLDPDLGLLPEYRGAKVYWLFHDNYLAAKVLADGHPQTAEVITRSLRREHAERSGKIEIVFGEAAAPLPFRQHELKDVRRAGDKIIRTEVATDRPLDGWQQYADLLLLACLAAPDAPAAREHWDAALKMWDGNGFRDAAARHHERYATYKLGLALLAACRLKTLSELPAGLTEKLLSLQDASGGWITDYDGAGNRVGKANVETTCLSILGIRALAEAKYNQP